MSDPAPSDAAPDPTFGTAFADVDFLLPRGPGRRAAAHACGRACGRAWADAGPDTSGAAPKRADPTGPPDPPPYRYPALVATWTVPLESGSFMGVSCSQFHRLSFLEAWIPALEGSAESTVNDLCANLEQSVRTTV